MKHIVSGRRPVSKFSREDVELAISAAGGSQVRAAEILGCESSYMNRLLRRYGIEAVKTPEQRRSELERQEATRIHNLSRLSDEERGAITERQSRQLRELRANQTPEEREEFNRRALNARETMPQPEYEAMLRRRSETLTRRWEDLPEEEKEAYRQDRRELFASFPPEKKQRMMPAIKKASRKRNLAKSMDGDVEIASALETHSTVGSTQKRKTPEIMADPQASADEIRRVAAGNRLLAMEHPNCPLDIWLDAAELSGWLAMNSPAFPLICLESPDLWTALEEKQAEFWCMHDDARLSHHQRRLYWLDCAEHVIPCFAVSRPNDSRLTAVARDTRALLLANEHLGDLYAEALSAAQETRQYGSAWWAAQSMAQASDPKGAIAASTRSSALIATGAERNSPASAAERLWQWRRLVAYLRGEV